MSSAAPPRWRPHASPEALRLRARLLAEVRSFFAARGVLEVDTPMLVRHAVTDPHLHSARVSLAQGGEPLFLATSPEYAMKRLLAAGSGDIYQLAHVCRADEHSRLHNAEFMLVEWYRCGWSMQRLMDETAQLAGLLLDLPAHAPAQSLTYGGAFLEALGLDPLLADIETLRHCAVTHGLDAASAARCDRDELCDWLMGGVIGPRLGTGAPCLVHHYPASQAALARLDPHDPRLALRFELYYRGVELANGFEELADAGEQRARFEADRRERARRALPVHAADERLLAALAHGLPACAGVALGFDRALMLRLGTDELSTALAFPLEDA